MIKIIEASKEKDQDINQVKMVSFTDRGVVDNPLNSMLNENSNEHIKSEHNKPPRKNKSVLLNNQKKLMSKLNNSNNEFSNKNILE